mmetsp:Transcript_339/g.1147  ORF Transcript_339/g.1147 Transcript_339/m.1147 type:complete len:233 (-) Transcript_339:597-1295(-)
MPNAVVFCRASPAGMSANRTKPLQLRALASVCDGSNLSGISSSSSRSSSSNVNLPVFPRFAKVPFARHFCSKFVDVCKLLSLGPSAKSASGSMPWPAEVTTVCRNCRALPSAKAGRNRVMSMPLRWFGLWFTTFMTSCTCSQFCIASTSARSTMQTSMDDKKSNSRFRSPAAPVIVRKPSGEQIKMSLLSKGVYNFIFFRENDIPRRKRSSLLPWNRWFQSAGFSESAPSSS